MRTLICRPKYNKQKVNEILNRKNSGLNMKYRVDHEPATSHWKHTTKSPVRVTFESIRNVLIVDYFQCGNLAPSTFQYAFHNDQWATCFLPPLAVDSPNMY